MRPQLIADAVAAKVEKVRERYGSDVGIFVAYADCGTAGSLDAYLEREGLQRIDGAHCYEFYAGAAAFEALQDEEIGTFYLTDFLARQFDDDHLDRARARPPPELLPMYFGNYRRVVYLAQTDDPELTARARAAADRLGLAFERRDDRFRRPRAVHPNRRTAEPPDMADPLDHLVARHPRPGRRQGRPPVEQGRPPPALPGRHRQGGEPRRQARVQQLHRRMAQDPSTLRRRPRGQVVKAESERLEDRIHEASPRGAHPDRRRRRRRGPAARHDIGDRTDMTDTDHQQSPRARSPSGSTARSSSSASGSTRPGASSWPRR